MRTDRRRGSALVLAIISFIVLAGIGAAFFSISISRQATTSKAASSDSTFHVAEAGIDDAMNRMTAYANTNPSSIPSGADFAVIGTSITDASGVTKTVVTGSVNNGTYTVEIIPAYAGKLEYRLRSSATKSTEKRGIETWVYPDPDKPFPDYGLFGDVSVEAGGTMTSDSYKSSLGAYNPTPHVVNGTTYVYDRPNGNVGSNGSVSTNGNSQIFGSATPGPNGTYSGGGFVLGSTTPATATQPLSPVVYSPPPGSGASFPNGSTTLGNLDGVTPATYHFSAINPNGPGTITVTSPVTLFVDGNFRMNNSQSIVLSGTNASVTIYQGSGDTIINGQALINGAINKASSFQVFSASSGDIQFNGGANVFAAVYAPNAAFTQNGTSSFFGAIVTSTVRVLGTGNFHYDEDIAQTLNNKVSYKVKSWKEFVP